MRRIKIKGNGFKVYIENPIQSLTYRISEPAHLFNKCVLISLSTFDNELKNQIDKINKMTFKRLLNVTPSVPLICLHRSTEDGYAF